jgi:histidinol dehydrogenase
MSHLIQIYDVERASATILRRQSWDSFEVPDAMLDFNQRLFGERIGPEEAVRRILADVRRRGDAGVMEWTTRLDGVTPESLQVPQSEVEHALELVDPEVIEALQLAAERIHTFHRHQPTMSWIHNDPDGIVGQLVRPIERVGVYVPGGTAPLPSTLLMTVIPALVAGVPHVSVITPPQRETGMPHPIILAAAAVAGVDQIYIAGGAQAIAALTFGTESIPAVDKICGPGNLFVTLAKRQVFGLVGIDGLPGPTETVVIGDETADPELAAADLLAQAEHDVLASAILLTPSRVLAEAVQAAVDRQVAGLSRQEILHQSLARGSGIVLTQDLAQAFALANTYAPEHLCLLVEQPWEQLSRVQNAGGVFLGERSFEVLGDYVAGPSHVMPTGGTARFASPTNVTDFIKLISVVGISEEALHRIGPAAQTLAQAEGLTAHAAAVQRRVGD